MEKKFRFITAIALISAMCLNSCNKAELADGPLNEPGTEANASQGWTVAISATMGADASTKALAEDPVTHKLIATFETKDNIYVYNKTKGAVDANPLHPDKDGASVMLTGTLAGSYEEGDVLVLCYNSGNSGEFIYNRGQKGTLTTVADYATAQISVTAADAENKSISGKAAFANQQSIFGFKFTNESVTVPVKALEVMTDGGKLVSGSNVNNNISYEAVYIIADEPISGTVYAALRNDNVSADTYHFVVNDGAGNLYRGDKAAPADKIVNGKYYSSSVALTQVELPTVTLTASGTSVGPNAAWDETLVKKEWPNLSFGYANYGDLTISGNSNGSWFEWFTQDASGGSRTITLNGTTITEPDGNHVPLENKDGNFTFILSGDNSITTCGSPAISFSGSSILFQGIGTLTITAATSEASNCVKGIKGSDAAPSPEAASGYALTVSDGVDNGNGTTTWVYTVKSTTSGSAAIKGGATQEWVQLWAGGPKWAKFNVGSTITTYSGVTEYTHPNVVGGYYSFKGKNDSVQNINGTSDTASDLWGNNWATPSSDQQQELLDKCNWTWCDGSTVQYESGCTLAGWKVTGKEAGYTSNSIFLPLCGLRDQNNKASEDVGSRACYWSSTSSWWYLDLYSYKHNKASADPGHGMTVRAIYVGD